LADCRADDSEETETIITDPSPVAHLRVIKAKLIPKADHIVPSVEEMKRLIGLDQPRDVLARSEQDDEDDREDGDDGEPLLHSNVLDRESQETLRVLRERASAAKEDGQDLSVNELVLSPSETSPDIVDINRRGRWFSAVVVLKQDLGEAIADLMRRHFSVLEGEVSLSPCPV
jgi:hypothetical protein